MRNLFDFSLFSRLPKMHAEFRLCPEAVFNKSSSNSFKVCWVFTNKIFAACFPSCSYPHHFLPASNPLKSPQIFLRAGSLGACRGFFLRNYFRFLPPFMYHSYIRSRRFIDFCHRSARSPKPKCVPSPRYVYVCFLAPNAIQIFWSLNCFLIFRDWGFFMLIS